MSRKPIEDNPVITMTSKKRGKCFKCGKMITPGDRIVWDTDNFRAFHAACLQVVQPAAPPATAVTMMIVPGDKAWYAPLAYEQVSERKAVKEAGFYWHGPDRCETGHCFPCNIGVPRKAWFTTDFTKANRLRSYATPQALAALDKLLETERKSEAAEPSEKSQRDIPIPAGLSYYPCQLAGIEWLQENHRTMIADEPGVGKTLQVLGLLNAEPRIRKTLILVQATVCRNWVREAARFLVVPTMAKVLYSSEDMHDLIVASQNQPVIGVTNYEKLVKGRGKGMLESIKSFDWDLIVVDEIHKLKNPKAAMSKAIIGSVKEPGIFRTIPRAIALTGTPVPNKTIELWPIISSLRPDVWKSIYSFGNRYTAKPTEEVPVKGKGMTTVWIFEGSKNEQELQTKLRSGGLMLRRLKSEVLKELPPKRRRVFALDPDSPDAKRAVKAQAAIYDRYDAAMTNAAVSQLSGDTGAFADQLAEIRRGEKADFQEMAKIRAMLGEAKIEPAISHISELLDSGTKKIVVFTHHQKVQDGLVAGLKDYNMVTILGRDSEKKRDNSVQAFQNDPSVRICLCSTLASGVGITLTAASHIVFVEFDWVPGNVVQAEDRCHRIGQSEPVVIDYLAFDETLDQRMAELIVEKLHLADAILDRKRQAGEQIRLDPSLGQPVYLMPDVEQLAVKPCPGHIKALLLESIHQLAEVCDGARQKDGMGFSAQWVGAGHRLARRSEFTDQEARLAKRIVLHHRKQVGIDPAQLEW
ncbi:MAG: DEAD/DEAH box helicase [Parcubacteria group bacterium]